MNFRKVFSASAAIHLLWILIISTLLGLIFFFQGWITSSKDAPFQVRHQLTWALSGWYLWAALFPLILYLCRRAPLDRWRWRRSSVIHLVAAIALSFCHAYLQIRLTNWMPFVQKPPGEVNIFANGYFAGLVMWRMVCYAGIVSVATAVDYYRRYREGQVLAAQIEARILRAQMEALKMQMDPDFLFDTLHSITELMHRDLAAADKLIARLGDFLRLTLDSTGTGQMPIRKELEFVKCYLEIQKIRQRDDIRVDFQIEPETLDARIPNLLLYSLTEEAVAARSQLAEGADRSIFVRTHRSEESLALEVIQPAAQEAAPALSRRSLDERMRQLYGTDFSLKSEFRSNGSRRTMVTLPWTLSEEESPLPEIAETDEVRDSELEWIRRNQDAEAVEAPAQNRWKLLRWSFLAFTILGGFFMLRDVVGNWLAHEPIQWRNQLTWLPTWYLWALAAPLIVAFTRKFPLERPHVLRNSLLHVACSVVILFAMTLLSGTYNWLLDPKAGSYFPALLQSLKMPNFSVDSVIYWMIVAVASATAYYGEVKRGVLRSIRLRSQLSRAQLQALKMQLHPHFLFNTLNSISELMQEDMDTAEKMLSQLERFLRLTVQNSDAQEVAFETELEFLKCYLEIERVRFQDRLSVRMQIEPQAMQVQVPNLLLQPIVENAIRHGIAPRSTTGRIDIRAQKTDGRLFVSIQDDGPGIEEEPSTQRKGLGLANTRERLHQLYGRHFRFELTNAPDGGLIVTLEIPAGVRA